MVMETVGAVDESLKQYFLCDDHAKPKKQLQENEVSPAEKTPALLC